MKPSGRNVLITGASGQDAYYVSRLCGGRGDHVVGVSRQLREDYKHFHRITSWADLRDTLDEVRPDEIYHLAACHHSSERREEDDGKGVFIDNVGMTKALLSAVVDICPRARVLLAGSCRMFGSGATAADFNTPLNEYTVTLPDSDDFYGIAKHMMLQMGRVYRRAGVYSHDGIDVCTAILFNHESPRRPEDYVTQKIARAAAHKQPVELRNLQARVDWGHAADYAHAMAMMLSAEHLDDYVVSSGELHPVSDFARVAYEHVGLDYRDYVSERGGKSSRVYFGDNTRITRLLGWQPAISFEQLVHEMVDSAK